ncbi:MAG: hypothetical protein RBR95_02405 [Ignavibacteriaceae bacterium]|jgi:hypothetical protein|nr:hypothetical protein [Ignavibacteriaceae bacterium]
MQKTVLKLTLLLVSLILLHSCSKDSNPVTPVTPPANDSTFASITWTQGTVAFGENELGAIGSNNEDYTNITFNKSNTKVSGLDVDDIIFIYGKVIRKITSVTDLGNTVEVEAEAVNMNEAIDDATIYWDKEVRFTSDMKKDISIVSGYPTIRKEGAEDVTFEVKFSEDLKGTITLKLNDAKLDATCEVIKKKGASQSKYAFEGYLQKFKNQGKIVYENSSLKNYDHTMSGLQGEITLSLTATSQLSELFGAIELPFVLLQIPTVVGGVPVVLKLKMLFVVNTTFGTIDASAYIKTKFSYNSDVGLKYAGSTVGVTANAGPIQFESNSDSIHVATSAAAGANFGLTFPRFEVSILGGLVVPYIHTAFLIGGSFVTGLHPCMKIDASFIGAVGYDFDFFGLIGFGGSKTLWQIDKNLKKAGDCP